MVRCLWHFQYFVVRCAKHQRVATLSSWCQVSQQKWAPAQQCCSPRPARCRCKSVRMGALAKRLPWLKNIKWPDETYSIWRISMDFTWQQLRLQSAPSHGMPKAPTGSWWASDPKCGTRAMASACFLVSDWCQNILKTKRRIQIMSTPGKNSAAMAAAHTPTGACAHLPSQDRIKRVRPAPAMLGQPSGCTEHGCEWHFTQKALGMSHLWGPLWASENLSLTSILLNEQKHNCYTCNADVFRNLSIFPLHVKSCEYVGKMLSHIDTHIYKRYVETEREVLACSQTADVIVPSYNKPT